MPISEQDVSPGHRCFASFLAVGKAVKIVAGTTSLSATAAAIKELPPAAKKSSPGSRSGCSSSSLNAFKIRPSRPNAGVAGALPEPKPAGAKQFGEKIS